MHAHICRNYFNMHRLKKCNAIAASSETTMPSLMTFILRRGKWTMGIVLDTYFHFA